MFSGILVANRHLLNAGDPSDADMQQVAAAAGSEI
jgi:hypothetical protein